MGAIETLDLFAPEEINLSLDEMVERAVSTLAGLMRLKHPIRQAFSSGKDSSACLALVMLAARKVKAEGITPLILPVTSDTLMENPEIEAHYEEELAKAEAFGEAQGFPVVAQVVSPTLASSFQLKILSGRGIPSFPGGSGDCTDDLKVKVQLRATKQVSAWLKATGLPEAITVVGLRLDESEKRRLAMQARQDSDTTPRRNKDGDLVLSPIALWSEDLVWEFIGESAAGTFGPCYSDFAEMKRIYANASATSCAVVADALSKGRSRGGCGARTGCWNCQKSDPKDLKNLIEYDEGRYGYLKPLLRINEFIRRTRYDWSRRHWVGRTIQGGYINIGPDTYHPTMIRDLTRYMLQADFDEMVRADKVGEAPRFRTLTPQMMLAVDALQSLNGLARPFQVWADWRDIALRGVRYDTPFIPATAFPPIDLPPTRFLHVGNSWNDLGDASAWDGLRDPLWEALTADAGCQPPLVELKGVNAGRQIWDVNSGSEFEVDEESLLMILQFELDHLLDIHDNDGNHLSLGYSYKWYQSFGCLRITGSQRAKHDECLRRNAHKHRLGLTLDYDPQTIYAKAVPFRDLPDVARAAWRKKASEEGSQLNLLDA